MKKPIDSAIILAALTAVLYCWSTAHYHGYLTTASLDAVVMERNFHQILYNGLVVSFGPIILILLGIAPIYFLYGRMMIPGYVNYARKGFSQRRKIVKLRNWWLGRRKFTPIEIREKRRANYCALILLVSVTFILSLAYFERAGSNKARDRIVSYYDGKRNKYSEIVLIKDGVKLELLYLGCGAKNCAGLQKETNKIFYFAQTIGYSFLFNRKNVTNQESGTPKSGAAS